MTFMPFGISLGIIAVLGILVGSFLNVVIVRLPLILFRQWQADCASLQTPPAPPFNLIVPRSHCPQCKHPLSAFENIPIISFLILKARCAHCQHPISWRYMTIEILTGVISLIMAMHFGFTLSLVYALLFAWGLIALAGIDLDHKILPDDITLPLLWLGLLANINPHFVPLPQAVLGAVAGYLFLWGVFWLFKFITGKEGLGQGDFKLLALLGAWCGCFALPAIILIASLLGSIVGLSLIATKQITRSQAIPFGPFLAFAGWITLLWGDRINGVYLRFMGLT